MVLVVRSETTAFFVEVFQGALRRRFRKRKERDQAGLVLVADINDTSQVQIFITIFPYRFVIDQGNLTAGQREKSVNPLSGGNAPKGELADHLWVCEIWSVGDDGATGNVRYKCGIVFHYGGDEAEKRRVRTWSAPG